MSEFTLDPYAARSCPVKTFNEFDPTLAAPALDHSLQETFAGGEEFRQRVLTRITSSADCVDLRGPTGPSQLEAETLGAMAAGAPVIVGGLLPRDRGGHRRGRTPVLVRGADRADGRPGYHPVAIKLYRVTEKQVGCRDLMASQLGSLGDREPLTGLRFRTSREGVLLELAHLWRMLDALGHAADPAAAIIGAGEAESRAVWVRLDHPFLRTFSRTSATGYRLRTALQRYDHEHGFRVHVAEQAMARTGVDDPEPVVRPIRIKECEWCPWWEHCRTQMDDDDLSLRLSKTPLDVRELQTLMGLGVGTVADLALADLEALLPGYLPLTTHRPRSEERLRIAAHRARMLMAGVELDKVSTEAIEVPRAEFEVDLDIETAEGDTVYLWGLLLTNRATGEQRFEHLSEFADLTPRDEVELAARFGRRLVELAAEHPGLRVFHYSDYETVHIRRLAERSGHPDIAAAAQLIRGHFVDLFTPIRDNFVGVDGLGLKVVATRGAGFAWRDEEPGGLNSQAWFATAVHGSDDRERAAARNRVLEYNEDDVRATWAVREWLGTL